MTLHFFIIFFICAYTEKIALGNKKPFLINFLPCSLIYFPSQLHVRKYITTYKDQQEDTEHNILNVVIEVSYYLSITQ